MGEIWQVLTPPPDFAEAAAWDVCHSLLEQGFGVAGAQAPVFAEPDLEQQWITGRNVDLGIALARSCAEVGKPSPDFPSLPDPYWFRGSTHSQFDDAIAAIGGPNVAAKVRIAHFDTGYDPHHHTLPKGLRPDLARNFVDADKPKDATDRSEGTLFDNFSHGCGTLSILAGATVPGLKPFGCAPDAEIVPVRVANRVVLFSNSSIAQGFDYVHSLRNSEATRVDVVSMSMGGLPSQAWADAINALYGAGIVVVDGGRKQFRQRADACRGLSGAVRAGHRGLWRDGERRALRQSSRETDGRQLRP